MRVQDAIRGLSSERGACLPPRTTSQRGYYLRTETSTLNKEAIDFPRVLWNYISQREPTEESFFSIPTVLNPVTFMQSALRNLGRVRSLTISDVNYVYNLFARTNCKDFSITSET